jgi:hypothetical protein
MDCTHTMEDRGVGDSPVSVVMNGFSPKEVLEKALRRSQEPAPSNWH